jgi:hypothetical protein
MDDVLHKGFNFSSGKGHPMTPPQANPLLPLALKLRACPTQNSRFSQELLRERWECFNEGWRPGNILLPSVIAALTIHDKDFAQLLNEAERAQMLALSKLALERFEENTNPPNKFGKTLAAILEVSK